jgi:symplekin
MPGTITVHDRLVMISVEKTVRVMLLNIIRYDSGAGFHRHHRMRCANSGSRNNQQTPFAGRISQHVQRLSQAKAELNDSFSRKRTAASQQDAESKRQKVDRAAVAASTTPKATPPPAPPVDPLQQMLPGPVTFAKLFTLATDPALTSFDGQQLPLDLVLQIVIGSMYNVDQGKLEAAIAVCLGSPFLSLVVWILIGAQAVGARYTAVMANPPPRATEALPIAPSAPQPQTADAGPPEPPDEMALVKAEKEEEDDDVVQLQLGEFRLPPPPSLSPQQAQLASLDAMDRMFSVIDEFEKTSLISRKSKLGVHRLAASNWDREGWIALLIRMATRGCQDGGVKLESGQEPNLPNALRERLYKYIIGDFRQRMDIAVAWLNEEWYNDQAMARSEPGAPRQPQYHKWMMKVMDAIFPFLEVRDRMFMRMLSEIPSIPAELLDKVKLLCLDPDRSTLGIQMLQ